jgi:hypothetical protein
MTTHSSPENALSAGSSGSPGPDFRKLYTTGVVGWALGMVVLFGLSWIVSKPETVPIAMLWMISHCWVAFLIGLVLMVIRGLLTKASLAKPLLAYVLPMVLLAGIAGICLAVYPDAGLRGDLFTYLPVVLVFYCFGCLWMALGGMDGGAFLRAVMPALIGGIIILGFVAVPAFASDSFRYREAFHFNAKESKIQNGTLIFDGSLEIMKPGNYEFSAPRYIWMDEAVEGGGADVELGEIQWGEGGAPKTGALGTFPLRIVWKKGMLPQDGSQSQCIEEGITLEVRRPDQGGKVVYSITASMDAAQASADGGK